MIVDVLHVSLAVLLFLAGGAALWFRQGAGPRIATLETALSLEKTERARDDVASRAAMETLRAECEGLRSRAEAAEQAQSASSARIAEREQALEREREHVARLLLESEQRFQALADAALRRSQEQFIQVADETFKKHKEGAQGELGAMLKPIHDAFGQFRDKVAEIEKVRSEDRARLDEQIRNVGDSARETQLVAGRLATALSAPRGGGRWGEETLRNVLEMAGLSPYADFLEQTSSETEKGRQRPDVIIRMPGGRELVIDSKVSLDDYLAAMDETDPAARKQRMAAHAGRVRAHVAGLSRKDYWKDFSERVDFVAMFIPGENFYAAVLEHDRDIFDYAARSNVIIVTPSTLIALAKSVAYGWRQEQMAKNAEEAARLGRELYERLGKMTEHMGRVGNGLLGAIKSFHEMVGSMEARVLPAARRFEELQFADPTRGIEDPQRIELLPRQPMRDAGAEEGREADENPTSNTLSPPTRGRSGKSKA